MRLDLVETHLDYTAAVSIFQTPFKILESLVCNGVINPSLTMCDVYSNLLFCVAVLKAPLLSVWLHFSSFRAFVL